jgi:mRNA interferase MazF
VLRRVKKTKPCLIISPDEMNDNLQTVIIAPMITKSNDYPTRVRVDFRDKIGWVVLDQIRTVDKDRLTKKLGSIDKKEVRRVMKTANVNIITAITTTATRRGENPSNKGGFRGRFEE